MRRRALLASLAGLAAGCQTAVPGNPSDPGGPSTDSALSPTRVSSACRGTETPTPLDGAFRITDLTTSTTTERPSHRFVLVVEGYYSAADVDRMANERGTDFQVRDVTDIEDEAVRETLVSTIDIGEWKADKLPDGLATIVEETDLFTGAVDHQGYSHAEVTLHRYYPERPAPIQFDAEIADATVSSGDPGAVELVLENVSDRTQRVFSGTVPPFGVVVAELVGCDREFFLWRPYEEEGCVTFEDDDWYECDIGVVTTVEPGERIERRYEILPADTATHPNYTVPPGLGWYRFEDRLLFSQDFDAAQFDLEFSVTFSLESGRDA